jgi:hypothetical protein
MKRMLMAAVIAAVVAGTSLADGLPSRTKLAQMGLSSMKVVQDQQGEQVRGKGFGAAYFSFRSTLTEGVLAAPLILLGPPQFVNNNVNTVSSSFVGAHTWGQDPRAAAGDGSPLSLNLATPNGVWTSSTFGISFGNGN